MLKVINYKINDKAETVNNYHQNIGKTTNKRPILGTITHKHIFIQTTYGC